MPEQELALETIHPHPSFQTEGVLPKAFARLDITLEDLFALPHFLTTRNKYLSDELVHAKILMGTNGLMYVFSLSLSLSRTLGLRLTCPGPSFTSPSPAGQWAPIPRFRGESRLLPSAGISELRPTNSQLEQNHLRLDFRKSAKDGFCWLPGEPVLNSLSQVEGAQASSHKR